MKYFICLIACFSFSSFANEFEGALKNFIDTKVAEIIANPVLIQAINAQNAQHANLTQMQIDQLDKDWRSQVGQTDAPLINKLLSSPTSSELKSIQQASNGLITEIFAMDNKGLNVAQSEITSDYWQGDEEKWQDTYLKGPSAYLIGEIEEDESTQMFQSQISHSVVDPSSGKVIGAITIGVNVEAL